MPGSHVHNLNSNNMIFLYRTIFFISLRPPDDDKRWPSIGNGHIATVVHSDTVYMNGLYNGNGSTSTRARIPAYISVGLNVTSGNIREKSYCLQMDNG